MNDIYHFHQTPPECAKECITRVPLVKGDRVLEPFRGEGAFYDNLPDWVEKDWCEITQGRDYKDYDKEYDWVITNPPFRLGDDGEKRFNAFWLLLDYYTQRAEKGVAFLGKDTCFGTLTPRRLELLKERGWGLTGLTEYNIRKWRGRYYLMVFEKDKPSIMGFVNKNY
jgi:hypothetical protein